jgi:hypothetical protein
MDRKVRKPLLEIASYHRSEQDARAYVGQLAERFGISNFKTKLTCDTPVTILTTGKPLVANLRAEVRQARVTGVPPVMQGLVDNSDRLMPPAMSLGASMGGTARISIAIGGRTYSLHGDGIHESPVTALADDVLHYRQQLVAASADHSLSLIARAYRTYLQVCISLVDAFLGHARFALGVIDPKIAASDDFRTVQSTAPFVERVDAWCRLWAQPPESFRQTKSWSDLSKLRQERNRYVHPAEPVYSLGIDEIVNVLNQCRDGIGGTLEYFRKIAGFDPCLSYIQKVKTAPIIKKSTQSTE